MSRKLKLNDIKAVINSFYHLQNTSPDYLPFKSLQIVYQRLAILNQAHIRQSALLEYVVQNMLCDLITSQLITQRGIFQCTQDVRLPTTYAQAQHDIEQDLTTGSVELLGWSFVYHVYLRQDLSFSIEAFADICTIHPRTLRRYKQRIYEQIFQQIIDMEVKAVCEVV